MLESGGHYNLVFIFFIKLSILKSKTANWQSLFLLPEAAI